METKRAVKHAKQRRNRLIWLTETWLFQNRRRFVPFTCYAWELCLKTFSFLPCLHIWQSLTFEAVCRTRNLRQVTHHLNNLMKRDSKLYCDCIIFGQHGANFSVILAEHKIFKSTFVSICCQCKAKRNITLTARVSTKRARLQSNLKLSFHLDMRNLLHISKGDRVV